MSAAIAPTPVATHSSPGWMSQVLDEIDLGIMVLLEGAVVYSNRSARHAVEEGEPFQLLGCQLCARRECDDALLQRTVADAVARGRRGVIALGEGGAALAAAVVPLPASHDAKRPVLLLLGKRRLGQQLTTHWFSKLHGLSPAESAVLTELLSGNEPKAIASRHGVAMSTVRSQINSIRGKTASRGMRDLLIAAATLPPLAPLVYTDAN